jgi:hypothetical protein
LFVIQTLLIGATIVAVVPHHVLLRLQVVVWTIGVVAIAVLVGVDAQDRFYSNDQVLHVSIVRSLLEWSWLPETSVVDMRLPYALPAVAISSLGISDILALKTVSLVCLLTLSHQLLVRFRSDRPADQLKTLYLTGCGLIGSFFSLLALRETMMMLFAYLFFAKKSPAVRALSITILILLRPHLAAALLAAETLVLVLSLIRTKRRLQYAFPIFLVLIGTVFGNFFFHLGRGDLGRGDFTVLKNFGLIEIRAIASNFAGLQFLTTGEWNVNFSVRSLILLRGLLSETIMIPVLFALMAIWLGPSLSRRGQVALVAFSYYVAIAINTDFNSFRQNIPLMPLLGAVILDVFAKRRQLKVSSLFSRRFGSAASPIVPRET